MKAADSVLISRDLLSGDKITKPRWFTRAIKQGRVVLNAEFAEIRTERLGCVVAVIGDAIIRAPNGNIGLQRGFI